MPSSFAQQKKLFAIIVPSPENPFFKAEADAANQAAIDARKAAAANVVATPPPTMGITVPLPSWMCSWGSPSRPST